MRRRISDTPSPSPALARLGLATPPPFVGRHRELSELIDALTWAPLLVVNGAVGSGKTRLVGEVARQMGGSLQVTRVACAPGDLGIAVTARCERAMDRMPGSFASVLHDEARLTIIDDVHHLPLLDVVRLVRRVADRPGAGRLLLITRDILPLPRTDARQFSLLLEGLDEPSARDLWAHLEELYGPTAHGTCDAAIAKTRAMPLAMRREYARSRYGSGAWELEALSLATRSSLEAVCVANLPVAPAAVCAVQGELDSEGALIDLVSRQLIDPLESGRFAVHDVVRDQVLAELSSGRRSAMELRTVALLRGQGRGNGAARPAWLAGDDGAIALLDPVDRVREIIAHLIAAGDLAAAEEELVACTRGALARGAGGELLAQIEKLREQGLSSAALQKVSALIAIRNGHFADAIELGSDLDEATRAFLYFRIGAIERSREILEKLANHCDANVRARAAATFSELHIASGNLSAAEQCLASAFEDRAMLCGASRAELHLAFAQIEAHRGAFCATRAALSRAANGADDGELAARVEVARVANLVDERRFREARELSLSAEEAVCEVDCVPLRDDLTRCAALAEISIGSASAASTTLRQVISSARNRGDEVGALRAQLDLAPCLLAAGDIGGATRVAESVWQSAQRLRLLGFAARATLIVAQVGLAELRIDDATEALDTMDTSALSQVDLCKVAQLQHECAAWRGEDEPQYQGESEFEITRLALARGDAAGALRSARRSAVRAERLGASRTLAISLAIIARLEFSRGHRKDADAAAGRAARESLASGSSEARIQSLLVLAAIARDQSLVRDAATYARDAHSLAQESLSPMLLIVAVKALDVIANDGPAGESEAAKSCAANASCWALRAAETMLMDLGFSSKRPFRCIAGDGSQSHVSSASPDLLGINERSLAIDAVRQVIVHQGEVTTNLRRRSLLKRLIFLFASAPHVVFSKEEIVERVWEVEYHPLRHDAALFTNIMRVRRLLRDSDNQLIVMGDDGYVMSPPADFLYVEPVA